MNKSVGKIIRQRRISLGMGIPQLAAKVGMLGVVVVEIENDGIDISQAEVERFAEALGLHPDTILGKSIDKVSLTWNEYFMDMARTTAKKSKDPSTKVGCVIVDGKHRPVSFGYNGFVAGCNEAFMTQERPKKYNVVIHAEMNAILFSSRSDMSGCKLYCTHIPCDNCLKHILQKGIREIYYENDDIIARFTEDQKWAINSLLRATKTIATKLQTN